jgi:translation initiation factor 2B subunit (eIF-2B alpha/beta/delta family)
LSRLLEILADRESGASEIERRLSQAWLDERPLAAAVVLESITDVVLERFAAMANLLAWVDTMWSLLESGDAAPDARLRAWLENRLEQGAGAPLEIGRRLAPLLERRPIVFTLSRSGTLLAALAAARLAGAEPRVRIAESRPEGEGLRMAADLVSRGLETMLLPDFALASLLGGFHPHGTGLVASPAESMLLVGADGIASSHFVNKTGTAALALVAREAGIPLLVAAGPEKLLPESLAPASEIGVEPWDAARGAVPGSRFDLERVANQWVDRFVLPEGVLRPASLAARIARRRVSRHLTARLAERG